MKPQTLKPTLLPLSTQSEADALRALRQKLQNQKARQLHGKSFSMSCWRPAGSKEQLLEVGFGWLLNPMKLCSSLLVFIVPDLGHPQGELSKSRKSQGSESITP